MNYQFLDPWHQFLPRQPGHVVCCMGSGGKTSLLLGLADLYRQEGVSTLLTTTTASEPLQGVADHVWRDGERASAWGDGDFVHAGAGDDGKWRGLAPADVDRLSGANPGRLLLCEVDGAAKRPLKLYRPGEPCWPAVASLALVVMGAGAVGRPAGEVIHRLGRPGVTPAELRELPAHAPLQWEHLAVLLSGAHGYLAQVPAGVPVVLVLAGMGSVSDSIGLFGFAAQAMREPRVPLLMFCELGADAFQIRTACRLDAAAGPA